MYRSELVRVGGDGTHSSAPTCPALHLTLVCSVVVPQFEQYWEAAVRAMPTAAAPTGAWLEFFLDTSNEKLMNHVSRSLVLWPAVSRYCRAFPLHVVLCGCMVSLCRDGFCSARTLPCVTVVCDLLDPAQQQLARLETSASAEPAATELIRVMIDKASAYFGSVESERLWQLTRLVRVSSRAVRRSTRVLCLGVVDGATPSLFFSSHIAATDGGSQWRAGGLRAGDGHLV